VTLGAAPVDLPLEELIKEEARRLGFILAGVTAPDPPAHASVFETWLGHGRHGSMDYLASERSRIRRADPRQIMPECRSIIVLAAPYSNPGSQSPAASDDVRGQPRGRVAAYAWGQDYHEVLPERLHALVGFIERKVGRPVSNRCCTDTAPILERDLAQRAGLGWIGKNTCLINPRHGSYVLLAEILVGIELKADVPLETDHCGKCTRCIEACPTECILPDRTIDARRCISYLTIELKTPIPTDLRSLTGNWIFGCDICQMVCPWNRFAADEGDRAFSSRDRSPRPVLEEQLRLSAEEFRSQFRRTAIQRAKFEGYLRNAAVAAGNTTDTDAIPSLCAAAKLDSAMVREHAAWAIQKLRHADEQHQ
jgi:epoxyqueuosine reductase